MQVIISARTSEFESVPGSLTQISGCNLTFWELSFIGGCICFCYQSYFLKTNKQTNKKISYLENSKEHAASLKSVSQQLTVLNLLCAVATALSAHALKFVLFLGKYF